MSGPQSRSEIKALLERHGLRPRKLLGQHFLADPNIVSKIVRMAEIGPGDLVVEVGPGTGTLTVGLAATGADVVAIEVDVGLRDLLAEVTIDLLNVELRFEDVTDLDLASAFDRPWAMVANLPYNVGTQVILDTLRHAPLCGRLVVMVQKEVAERLVASPGGKDYGIPSVVVGLTASVTGTFSVPAQVFVPAPNVGSAVVVLDRRPRSGPVEEAIRLAGAAFGPRRKMVRSSLRSIVGDPIALCERAAVAPTARAEELSPDDYLRLAGEWAG